METLDNTVSKPVYISDKETKDDKMLMHAKTKTLVNTGLKTGLKHRLKKDDNPDN